MADDVLTTTQETAINEIAVSMFDFDVPVDSLAERLEATASDLGCTVAQLVAIYVRHALTVFADTPRSSNILGTSDFDLGYARKALQEGLAESSGVRVAFRSGECSLSKS